MARGMMNVVVQETATRLLGKELTREEVRLMPYLMLCLMENCKLDRSRINQADRNVLEDWKTRGWITLSGTDVKVNYEFYKAITAILAHSYCSEYISDYSDAAPLALKELVCPT